MPARFVERAARVFIPQYSRTSKMDLTDLERYGKITVISWTYTYPDQDNPGKKPMEEAMTALQDFDPGIDYVALVGSYVHMAACSYTLGILGKSPVALLVYDRVFQQYYPVDLNTGDIDAVRLRGSSQSDPPRPATKD
jgi:hypothetical protein